MRRADQAAAAASSTSSGPARPAAPRSPGTTMPAAASAARRASRPAHVALLARIGRPDQERERQLGVDLPHGDVHARAPRLDVEDLGAQRPRLAAGRLAGQAAGHGARLGVGRRGVGGTGRGEEQARPLGAEVQAGRQVGGPGTGLVGDAQRHVDADGRHRPRGRRQLGDGGAEDGPRERAVGAQHDAHPAGPAAVDPQHMTTVRHVTPLLATLRIPRAFTGKLSH